MRSFTESQRQFLIRRMSGDRVRRIEINLDAWLKSAQHPANQSPDGAVMREWFARVERHAQELAQLFRDPLQASRVRIFLMDAYESRRLDPKFPPWPPLFLDTLTLGHQMTRLREECAEYQRVCKARAGGRVAGATGKEYVLWRLALEMQGLRYRAPASSEKSVFIEVAATVFDALDLGDPRAAAKRLCAKLREKHGALDDLTHCSSE